MSDTALARDIEAAALRSWPAIEEVSFAGWTLRFSEGFTGRANSVQSVTEPAAGLEARVAHCEAWYRERERPCLFRMTPFSEPGLDELLAGRGYERYDPTRVLRRAVEGLAPGADGVELRPAALHAWLGTFAHLSGWPSAPEPMRRILELLGDRSLQGILWETSPRYPAACGLGVLDGRFVGLFDLVVAPERRRRGYGAELVRRLVAWGEAGGARHVYLQVTEDNAPALGLYEKLGFRTAYDYWYRRRTP